MNKHQGLKNILKQDVYQTPWKVDEEGSDDKYHPNTVVNDKVTIYKLIKVINCFSELKEEKQYSLSRIRCV